MTVCMCVHMGVSSHPHCFFPLSLNALQALLAVTMKLWVSTLMVAWSGVLGCVQAEFFTSIGTCSRTVIYQNSPWVRCRGCRSLRSVLAQGGSASSAGFDHSGESWAGRAAPLRPYDLNVLPGSGWPWAVRAAPGLPGFSDGLSLRPGNGSECRSSQGVHAPVWGCFVRPPTPTHLHLS